MYGITPLSPTCLILYIRHCVSHDHQQTSPCLEEKLTLEWECGEREVLNFERHIKHLFTQQNSFFIGELILLVIVGSP